MSLAVTAKRQAADHPSELPSHRDMVFVEGAPSIWARIATIPRKPPFTA